MDRYESRSYEAFTPSDNDIVWAETLNTNDWKIEARVPYAKFHDSSAVIRNLQDRAVDEVFDQTAELLRMQTGRK